MTTMSAPMIDSPPFRDVDPPGADGLRERLLLLLNMAKGPPHPDATESAG
ncbi:hypothetical protein [Sphingomonas sp. SFZ2018-12]|nr:hypothetical protein [Sphingomonas sp. SFZ2018-12]